MSPLEVQQRLKAVGGSAVVFESAPKDTMLEHVLIARNAAAAAAPSAC